MLIHNGRWMRCVLQGCQVPGALQGCIGLPFIKTFKNCMFSTFHVAVQHSKHCQTMKHNLQKGASQTHPVSHRTDHTVWRYKPNTAETVTTCWMQLNLQGHLTQICTWLLRCQFWSVWLRVFCILNHFSYGSICYNKEVIPLLPRASIMPYLMSWSLEHLVHKWVFVCPLSWDIGHIKCTWLCRGNGNGNAHAGIQCWTWVSWWWCMLAVCMVYRWIELNEHFPEVPDSCKIYKVYVLE
jgi:hypothetical protein